ncbi:MAG: (Fe-S)-binding protein [Chloroflexi bacterium]|nr:(Fe-S)-binding protein [Chloroflexota bacterium]
MTPIQLFVTCLVDHLTPHIATDVVTVLERQGVQVQVPPHQTCCGQPAFNGGFRDEARAMAEHFLDVFAPTQGPIVTPSGSCAAMVVHHYPQLFADDPANLARAQAVAARVREFSQFLVDDLGLTYAGGIPGHYTYHPSCHLTRDLGVRGKAEALLDAIPHSERHPLPDAQACCGFGGLFAVKMPAISTAMMNHKLETIRQSGADVCVTCDSSCMMHLNGGLIAQGKAPIVKHLAQILAQTEGKAS